MSGANCLRQGVNCMLWCELYALVSVATSLKYSMTREDVLIACNDQSNAMLNMDFALRPASGRCLPRFNQSFLFAIQSTPPAVQV